jgi:hypothetical protein
MIEISGQTYEREKPSLVTIQHRICFYGRYELNKDGLYQYKECDDNVVTSNDYFKLSDGNERFFGYDKKYNRYYFYTNNIIGYYSPTKLVDTKDFKKKIIDNKVPIFSLEDVPQIKSIARNILDKVYKEKNDSINEVRRIAKEKQREKEIKDSLEAIKRKAEKLEEYRKNHSWHDLILDYAVKMNCKFCDLEHLDRTFYVLSLSSDTIYYLQDNPNIKMLGKSLSGIHYAEINDVLKQSKKFKEYLEIWHDSLALHNEFTNDEAKTINLYTYVKFKSDILKEAPYGFIGNWGWDLNSADGVEPYFSFINTSEKTIKYVDFYFSLYNAVGDRCYLRYDKSYTGHVRGVGPVEPGSTGSWEWDRATHYTSADASEMKITKIVITFMDKTVRTLTGNAIKYE